MTSAYHRVLCKAIVVTSANNTIIFREDGSGTDRTATIAAGTYYLIGDDSASDILGVIVAAMNNAPLAENTHSLTAGGPLTSTPFFGWTITTDGTSFAFMTTGTTFPLADIGWDSAISGDFAVDTSFAADSTIQQVVTYSPGVISSVQDPTGYDNEGVYHHRRPDGSYVAGSTADPVRRWPLLWEYVSKGMSLIRHEIINENSWEQFWRDINAGATLRLYEGLVSTGVWTPTLVAEGTLSLDSRQAMDVPRDSDVPTFRIESTLVEDMS